MGGYAFTPLSTKTQNPPVHFLLNKPQIVTSVVIGNPKMNPPTHVNHVIVVQHGLRALIFILTKLLMIPYQIAI